MLAKPAASGQSWGAREAADLDECRGLASGQERALRATYAPLPNTLDLLLRDSSTEKAL